MKSLLLVPATLAVFAGAAYLEHKDLEDRLDAEAEMRANLREFNNSVAGFEEESLEPTAFERRLGDLLVDKALQQLAAELE